jgi:secreted trypsin-like serine protease
MCGGSVISPNWVMTAGHCVYGNTNSPSSFKIKAGIFQQSSTSEPDEQIVEIDQIILHPLYVSSTTSHDVALLKLKTPITFGSHVQPVCLPQSDGNYLSSGKSVTVTGWGTTSQGGSISEKLRQVVVPCVDYTTCNKEYSGDIMQDVMFCAGVGGKDSCQGDSGGPVVSKHSNGKWYQHGIVSWGNGCAQASYPGVYSKVSAYCDFIKKYSGVSCSA